jgi:hypothetical protein
LGVLVARLLSSEEPLKSCGSNDPKVFPYHICAASSGVVGMIAVGRCFFIF